MAHLFSAHGADAEGVPVRPEQHQHRDPDPAAAVSGDEPQTQEPPGGARRAQPVCRRDGRLGGHDHVRLTLLYILMRGTAYRHMSSLLLLLMRSLIG